MTLSQPQIDLRLHNIAKELELLAADARYQWLENSEDFHTSNDLKLADAIQAVTEIQQALSDIEAKEEFHGLNCE